MVIPKTPRSTLLPIMKLLLVFAVLKVNLSPIKSPISCKDIPEQKGTNLFGSPEQSFKANLTSHVYYCRKIFADQRQAFEIVLQKISESSEKPDSIEVTDCHRYHYVLTIDHSCHFQFPTPSCVRYCQKNSICPSEATLCTTEAPFRQFYPETDLNHENDALYNFNDTLRVHCDSNMMNELPIPEARCHWVLNKQEYPGIYVIVRFSFLLVGRQSPSNNLTKLLTKLSMLYGTLKCLGWYKTWISI